MADYPVPASPSDNKHYRWRDHVRIHPAAELFPLLPADELQKLADDIKKRGVEVTPTFFKDEQGEIWLLDGRNRLDAMELAGDFLQGPVQRFLYELLGNDPFFYEPPEDPYEVVVSLNILRRHLGREQKQELIDKLLAENPDRSDRQTAALAKVSPTTVGTRRERLEETGAIPKVTETVGGDGRIRTATPQRAPREPPSETVKIEKDDLVRLRAGRYARDSGDLFSWATDAPAKIARVLVLDALAQGAAMLKVQLTLQAALREVNRLEEEARAEKRAEAERAGETAPLPKRAAGKDVGPPSAYADLDFEKMKMVDFEREFAAHKQRLGEDIAIPIRKEHSNGRYRTSWKPILKELAAISGQRAAELAAKIVGDTP